MISRDDAQYYKDREIRIVALSYDILIVNKVANRGLDASEIFPYRA